MDVIGVSGEKIESMEAWAGLYGSARRRINIFAAPGLLLQLRKSMRVKVLRLWSHHE